MTEQPYPATVSKLADHPKRRDGGLADRQVKPDDGVMSAPTREEFDAKLEASEARLRGEFSTGFARLEGAIANLAQSVEATNKSVGELKLAVSTADSRAHADARETQKVSRNTRWSMIAFTVATLIALAAGILAYDNNRATWLETGKTFNGDPTEPRAVAAPAEPPPAKTP